MTQSAYPVVVGVGDEAPDFTLRNQNHETFTLSSMRGHKAVLIIFYPFAFTGICTGELRQVRDDLSTFQNGDVQIVTISVDSTYSLKIFSEREGFEFPLLSDFWPHGAVAKTYDVFFEKAGMALRGTFLVDVDGVIRFAEANGPGEARDQSAWKRAVAALPVAAG